MGQEYTTLYWIQSEDDVVNEHLKEYLLFLLSSCDLSINILLNYDKEFYAGLSYYHIGFSYRNWPRMQYKIMEFIEQLQKDILNLFNVRLLAHYSFNNN